MSHSPHHRPRPLRVWPALLATVLVIVVLLGGYTWMESRRLQRSLARELEERAAVLIGVLEASSRNAITAQTALEEVLAQRLLDNARFIDFLIGRSPRANELIQRVITENHLAKVEVLDSEGNPISLSSAEPSAAGPAYSFAGRGMRSRRGEQEAAGRTPMPMMRGMMGPPDAGGPPPTTDHPGMPFMWGMRWGGPRGDPSRLFPSLPKNAKIRRFWEGSAFGVAVPAQSVAGVIVIHADAQYLLSVRREVGPQRLIEEMGKQSGVTDAALLDRDLTVLASTDPTQVGRRDSDAFLQDASAARSPMSRRRACGPGCEVYEVARPFALEKDRTGLIRIGLSMAGVSDVQRQAQRSMLWYSVALLGVGAAASAIIFWMQSRHLSERGRLEAAMVREQRLSAMGNLAAGVAHEIRNPLNAISVGLQRLRLEFSPATAESRTEYLDFTRLMEGEVRRLNTTVDRFLTLARPLRLTKQAEPILVVLKDQLSLLVGQAEQQGVRLVEELALPDVKVSLDRQQFGHALMNVLQNALQAMPNGGTLIVRADLASGPARVRIAIADTGPGLPPDLVDRIFEPYFTAKEGGTGLGLALTHRIVLEHGGSVRAERSASGGAQFVIELPLEKVA